jgi:hypothetical protein
MGVKKFLGGTTYFQNLFLEGVPAGGVGIGGAARIEFSSAGTTLYGGSKTLQVNNTGTVLTGSLEVNDAGTGGVRATTFSTYLTGSPSTPVANLFGRSLFSSGSGGTGIYLSNSNVITPTGPSDAQVDAKISLGNPEKRWKKVWTSEGVVGYGLHYQNGDEAMLSINDLVDVLKDLRDATQGQSTFESLRESMTGCLDQIVGRMEKIQSDAKDHLDDLIKESEITESK